MNTLPDISETEGSGFRPAPDMAEWMRETFIDEEGGLSHDRHAHLRDARIAVLWSSHEYERRGQRVLGKAEQPPPHGIYGWDRGRMMQQLAKWFGGWFDGESPDFLITLYEPYVANCLEEGRARAICALVEHELCHCAQQTDEYGTPEFSDATGRPKWTIAGHDAEVFVHEVARYGAYSDELKDLRTAFEKGPSTDEAVVRGVCGCGAPVTG